MSENIENIGTLVTAPIRPYYVDDLIPTALSNEIYGGVHSYTTIVERDSIIEERRNWGMFCTVYDDTVNSGTYQLVYNYKNDVIMDNDNWVLFSTISRYNTAMSSHYWLEPVNSLLLDEPISPVNGERYIVGLNSSDTPTGINWEVYVGGFIAEWNDIKSNWEYYFPENNWSLRVNSSDNSVYRYDGDYPSGVWVKELVNQLISFQAETLNGFDYTASYPGFLTYSTDYFYTVTFGATNSSGVVSLDINGSGSKLIKKQTNTGPYEDLMVGDILPNRIYQLFYDGTYFRFNKTISENPFDVKWKISTGEVVQVPNYNEYLLWGDLTVQGNLDIDEYGKVVILNGALNLDGGTVSNIGNIHLVNLLSGVKKFSATQSMISGVTYSITHGLNTKDLTFESWNDTDGFKINDIVVKIDSLNSISFSYSSNIDSVRLVIIG